MRIRTLKFRTPVSELKAAAIADDGSSPPFLAVQSLAIRSKTHPIFDAQQFHNQLQNNTLQRNNDLQKRVATTLDSILTF